MGSIPIARLSFPIARSIFLLLLLGLCLPVPSSARVTPESLTEAGHRHYFLGEHEKALAHYEKAVAISSSAVKTWLNGAVVLEEAGRRKQAVLWYRRAAALSADPDILNALGWALLRSSSSPPAQEAFRSALKRRPDHALALLGLGRIELGEGRPARALEYLDKARAAAPLLNLIPYFQASAYGQLGRKEDETQAYRQVVAADFLFHEARHDLGRSLVRSRRFADAWRHLAFLLGYNPRHRGLRDLLQKIKPKITSAPSPIYQTPISLPRSDTADSGPAGGRAPLMRVGIGSNSMGKPSDRTSWTFTVNGPFSVIDSKTGRILTSGRPYETWTARLRKTKRQATIEILSPGERAKASRGSLLLIRPLLPAKGVISIDTIEHDSEESWRTSGGKYLRGELELSIHPPRNSLKLVNILDLESYTHGVVGAEMPNRSPLEALKVQAVLARSHALYVKTVSKRHRREGYDVCDQQHCQMYTGLRAEDPRSRAVVLATEGRIVTHGGRVAHVIYSSNCGGHTQSGRDVTGWGDVPYWSATRDGVEGSAPRSPWELRSWLQTVPASFCKPSHYVHAANYRWNRVVSFSDLEAKINRQYKTGNLQTLRPGRRAISGNVNSLRIQGSKRKVLVVSEDAIRGILGLGSLRSTLFVLDAEYDQRGKPVSFIFSGGGWGHGVGLCQSGAMGRAEAGETFEQTIKAYFKGAELGSLRYGK